MLLQASCSLRSAGAKYRSPLAPASRPAVGARRVRRLAAAADETQPTPVDAAAVSIDAVTVESSSPVPQAAEARESFMPQGSAAESNALEQEELDLLPEDEGEPTLSQSVQTLWDKPLVKGAVVTAGAFLGITFAISVYKVWVIYNSSRSKRKRTVDKNLVAVEALKAYCPGNRAGLTPSVIRGLSSKTGFSKDLIFRKYLRYILNERPFDSEAVEDIIALRSACTLSEAEVADVIKEVAERTYKKTGILMRRPKGMTAEGLARKVQGRAVFSKLLYLAEMDGFLAAENRDSVAMALLETFGATSDDAASLRIPSLKEMTVDDLERMWAAGGKDMPGDAEAAAGAAGAEGAGAPGGAAGEKGAEGEGGAEAKQ